MTDGPDSESFSSFDRILRKRSEEEGQFFRDWVSYPQDLGDPGSRNQHYVVFFINVPSHSKIGKTTTSTNEVSNTARGSTLLVRQAGRTQEGLFAETTDFGDIVLASGMVQLEKTIALYMPNNLVEQYSANYGGTEISDGVAAVLNMFDYKNGNSGNTAEKGMLESIYQSTASLVGAAGQGALNSIDEYLKVGLQGFANAQTKTVFNRQSEQYFSGMNFRDFNFQFELKPKNKQEARDIIEIINTFKYFMHPETTNNNNFLIFPAEFEIEFYTNDKINRKVGGISTCSLVGMNVNYTPNQIWSAVANEGGMPSAIVLDLQFRELELLTKNRLDDWGEGANNTFRE